MKLVSKLPNVTLIVLQAILGGLDGIGAQIKDALAATLAADDGQKKRWANHIPQLAAAFANMMDLDPTLFTWVAFSALDLRNLNATVEILREIKAFLDSVSGQVGLALALYREQLFALTTDGVADLQRVIDSPTTDPKVRDRLTKIAEGVNTIIDARNKQIKGRRSKTKSTNTSHQDEVNRLNQEKQVLRGGDLPAAASRSRSRSKKR